LSAEVDLLELTNLHCEKNHYSPGFTSNRYAMSFSYRKSRRYERELETFICDKVLTYPIFSSYRLVNFAADSGTPIAARIRRVVEFVDQLISVVFLYPIFIYEVLKLTHLYWKIRPEVLHINNGGYPGARSARSAACAGRLCRIPNIIMTINNLAVPTDRLSRIFEHPIDRLMRLCVGKFVAASELGISSMISVLKLPVAQTAIVENAVKEPSITVDRVLVRQTLNYDPNHIVIGVVAGLEKRKGHAVLFKAIENVLTHRPSLTNQIKVCIVGDGPLASALHDLVSKLGISSVVQFLGYRYDYLTLMSAFDVLVLSSISNEDSPLSTIEAMSLGIPVVVSDLAGLHSQVIDGHNGFRVPVGDPDSLSKAIISLSTDVEIRRSMGIAARDQYLNRFLPEVFVDNYLKIYGRSA
jgi:glycosyltransferase involved in cell wall biosynthesis